MNNSPATSASDDLANGQINKAVSSWAADKAGTNGEGEAGQESLQNLQHYNLYCRDCDKVFHLLFEFKCHLLSHVQLPSVLVDRLKPSYVRRLTSSKPYRNTHKGRKRNFARKRTRSYIVPKVKTNKVVEPLKLTLKLATDATTENPSFEVVPQKILVGPGDLYPANGGVLDEVKTEVITQSEDVEWNNKSVEGEGEKEGEGAGRTLEGGLESSEENSGSNNVQSVEQDESVEGPGEEEEEEVTGDKFEEEEGPQDEAVEDSCLENDTDLDRQKNQQQAACSSPTPSEQLRPEFLAPEEDSCDSPPSPAMVEISGNALAEASSPAFPSTSPAPPATSGDSNSQHSTSGQDQESAPLENTDVQSGEPEDQNDGQTETSLTSEAGNFNWNDVDNVAASNVDDQTSNAEQIEERDPLMIPDQAQAEAEHENDNSENLGEGNSSDSLLRGFLCDPSSGDKAITVTTSASNVGNVMDGLGSEYISLERLGVTSALSCCDVCGEQSSNLEEHRARAGHYKCGHPDCGNQVFPNLAELSSHQHVTHGNSGQQSSQPSQPPPPSQQYPMPHQQPPPVQQLAQQVQRLPIPPPQQLSPHQMNHHPAQPMVQQMSPQMHQLMPPQQPYPQAAVRRPPPLYRVPATGNVPGAPPGMQHPYPQQPQQQQQHMMPQQMYNQQPYPQAQNNYPPPGGGLTPPRPYGNMVQQMSRPRAPSQHSMQRPTVVQQQQQQPRMVMQQKRPAVVANAPGGSPNKQRRMDVLIPDRHDDADCHVIAMQKRTDSGPVIGNVQGSANNSGRPESTIHLTDSITLSVRQPQGGAVTGQPSTGGGKNSSDAKAVANILATRGITVTPAGGTGGRGGPQQSSPQQQQRQSRPSAAPQSAVPTSQPVTTLNLNRAISIIAQPTASSSRQPQGNFAVPHGRGSTGRTQQQQQMERPPRPPTVDLTGDGPPPPPMLHTVSRGRGRGGRGSLMGRHTCQVCDKAFSTQESLNQHMALHRSPGKLPYRCSLCSAQYPTQQGLLQHRQAYHKEPPVQPGAELAIPVVDLKSPGVLNRLASLGVHHYIPLSQLGSQAGGYFGLPVVSVEGARNPAVCNLGALGAASVLSLGPIKQLGR
ncbi:uncharacterized protein [Periplaneta americana]